MSWYLVSILLIIAMAVYLAVETMIIRGQTNQAFKFWPYFSTHRKLFEESSSLNSQDKNKLLEIYANYPEMYHLYMINSESDAEKITLKEKLIQLDPWQMIYQDLTKDYLDQEKFTQAGDQLKSILELKEKANQVTEFELRYEQGVELSEQAIEIANYYGQNNLHEESVEYYHLAQEFNQWSLGEHTEEYVYQISQVMYRHLENKNFDQIFLITEQLLSAADWMHWQIWVDGSTKYTLHIDKALAEDDVELSQKYAVSWFEWWQFMDERYGQDIDYASKEMLADKLLLTATPESNNLDKYLNINIRDYESEQEIIRSWQGETDRAVTDQDWDKAEKIVKTMQKLWPNEYWMKSQLGHYYMMRGSLDADSDWLDKAQQEYSQCLDDFDNDHAECYFGLLSIEEGRPYNRFSEAGQIIRGEKDWWDF